MISSMLYGVQVLLYRFSFESRNNLERIMDDTDQGPTFFSIYSDHKGRNNINNSKDKRIYINSPDLSEI